MVVKLDSVEKSLKMYTSFACQQLSNRILYSLFCINRSVITVSHTEHRDRIIGIKLVNSASLLLGLWRPAENYTANCPSVFASKEAVRRLFNA